MAVSGVGLAAVAAGSVFAYAGVKGISIPQAIQAIVQGRSPATLPQANPITTADPAPSGGGGGGGSPTPPGGKAPGDLSTNPGGGGGGGGGGASSSPFPKLQLPQVAPPAALPYQTHVQAPPSPKPSYSWYDPRGWF